VTNVGVACEKITMMENLRVKVRRAFMV
jgi:hypothetical protein